MPKRSYERCPTCGQRVSVATSGEGTSHYIGVDAEDARDADAASMQAAFWRARALELGANEDEWRRFHDA